LGHNFLLPIDELKQEYLSKNKLAFHSKENPKLFLAISKPVKGCSWG
jgi:hypothetical protein